MSASKYFAREAAKKIAKSSKMNGFSYDVETFLIAKKRKLRLIEFPVSVIHSYADSKVKILKHAPKMFLEVLQIKWYDLLEMYKEK